MESPESVSKSLQTDLPSLERLQIHLFGGFDLLQNGHSLPRTRSRTEKWLLSLLVLRTNQTVERTWLAGTLWPDTPSAQAFNNLRRSLSNLRQVLGAEGYRLFSPTASTLTFDLAGAFCDVVAFDAAIARGDMASLLQAAALYRGPLLETHDADWVASERAVRRERYLEVLEILADDHIKSGDSVGAARLLRRALEADPLSEETHRRLMQILGQQGDYAAVEKQFRQLRQHLRNELNMEPCAETVALHRDLLKQAQFLSNSRSEITSFPPENRRFPLPFTSLVGRTRDRQAVCDSLQASRLVTLTGPGGVGKTRLSIAVAEMVAEHYADGVVFVDLVPTSDVGTLVKAITVTLGFRTESDLSPEEALRHFLLRKKLLLILDNAEHVLPACAQIAAILLSQCPLLHILCTSREPLHVVGEHVRQVSPLETPPLGSANDPVSKTTRLLSYDAVALLLERVAAASADFRLTVQNAEAVAQICRRLDGMPLALELVAARFRSLSAPEIAVRLEDYFRLLSAGNPILPRHRTLRATIEWSYSLLSEAEQVLLRRLSVFVGGWTLEAAEAICPSESESVLLLLLSLVEKSLVVYDPQEDLEHYRLLEMTREYAAECLSPEEQDIQRERHAAFFLQLARGTKLQNVEFNPVLWYAQVRLNYDNLRAAHLWWQERNTETALWLEYRLYLCGLEKPGDWRTRIARLEADPLPTNLLSLLITFQTGCWAVWTGHPAGETLLLRAVEMASACDEEQLKMSALSVLANLERERGNDLQVLAYADASLQSAHKQGEIFFIATMEMVVCEMLAKTGAMSEALRRMQTQLERGRQENDWRLLLPALDLMGKIAHEQREWNKAHAYWEELLPMVREHKPDGLPNKLRDLADNAREKEDYPAAWQYLEQGILASRRNRAPDREGWIRWDMAALAFRKRDIPLALEQLHLGCTIFQEIEEARSVTQCLRKAAQFHAADGRHEKAALLLGGVERRIREQSLVIAVDAQQAYRQLAADLSRIMGEKAWQAAFERGQALTFEEAETLAFTHGSLSE